MDTEFPSQVFSKFAAGMPRAELQDRARGQANVRAAALSDHVQGVVRGSAEEQVSGIDTERVVPVWAIVTDLQAIRDRADGQFVANAMSKQVETTGMPSAFADQPVSRGIGAACPQPAAIGFVNLGPESFGQRLTGFASAHARTDSAAVKAEAACNVARLGLEGLAANRTLADDDGMDTMSGHSSDSLRESVGATPWATAIAPGHFHVPSLYPPITPKTIATGSVVPRKVS